MVISRLSPLLLLRLQQVYYARLYTHAEHLLIITFAGKNDCTHSSKNNYIDIHVVLSYNGNAEMAFRAIFTGDEVLGMLDTEGEDGGMDDVFFAGSDEEFGMHEEEIERYMYNIIRRHRYSTWVNSYFLA